MKSPKGIHRYVETELKSILADWQSMDTPKKRLDLINTDDQITFEMNDGKTIEIYGGKFTYVPSIYC